MKKKNKNKNNEKYFEDLYKGKYLIRIKNLFITVLS